MDETYIKVRGEWRYLYRAVDKAGCTIDFLLTARRDTDAAQRFLRGAVERNGLPDKINIDKSGANAAGIDAYNEEAGRRRRSSLDSWRCRNFRDPRRAKTNGCRPSTT